MSIKGIFPKFNPKIGWWWAVSGGQSFNRIQLWEGLIDETADVVQW